MALNSRQGFRGTFRRCERGYILLTLILFVGLLAIAATIVTPMITFRIRRDREEEMIHRGVQYSRAVRRYFKKFGRYPVRLEDLESTNNFRFLRQRYKDPITGQDFKLLHFGEVKLAFGAGIAGASLATNGVVGGLAGVGAQPAIGGGTQANVQVASVISPASGNAAGMNGEGINQNPAQNPAQNTGPNTQPFSNLPQQNGPSTSSSGSSGDTLGGKVFGGGPIVGVVSTSEKESIREFNKKNHYNEWQFIYDPSTDRGGPLNTPAQPPLQVAAPNVQPGQPGAPNGMGSAMNPGAPNGMGPGPAMNPGNSPPAAPPAGGPPPY
jgi:type II secretory pathway pseudopilin PulG